MRKVFMTFIAVLGLVGFAAAAQAACLDMAKTEDTTTVATDSTTTIKPILQEQSGG
ncbi:MAG: hypothetical protein IMF08_02600 [Proteobacteria bacterium]|nr:hypothetical protein [Pseudomonadota bacterium]